MHFYFIPFFQFIWMIIHKRFQISEHNEDILAWMTLTHKHDSLHSTDFCLTSSVLLQETRGHTPAEESSTRASRVEARLLRSTSVLWWRHVATHQQKSAAHVLLVWRWGCYGVPQCCGGDTWPHTSRRERHTCFLCGGEIATDYLSVVVDGKETQVLLVDFFSFCPSVPICWLCLLEIPSHHIAIENSRIK